MSKIVGIDLGTTNSLVAAVDSGLPYVIADSQGRRLTPSVVHFPAGAPPVVGQQASRVRALKPAETVYSIKRFMGRRASEISLEDRLVHYPLSGAGTRPLTIALPGRAVTPEEVSAEILMKLRRDAEAALGEPVDRAVITVPAYFNDAQRNATKKAGQLAGFTVERIINEPTAAALAYGLDKIREKSKIAVYDLGGGTFDLSILELNKGVFQVLSTNGNTRLGGDDLDTRLVEYFMDRFRAAGGPDISSDPSAMARTREVAEHAKIRLSTEDQITIALPFIAPDFHFECVLKRGELEDLTRDIVERTRAHCLRSLADARLKPADLDQVILVGGQTRMPLVRHIAAEIFGCAESEETAGPRLNTTQNPDEAVALGAAIQAEILAGGFKNVLLLDITPLSLGLETFGGLMSVLIPRNSTIPIKAGEMFTTAVDQQRQILIHVLQGERERAADNWSLGRFTIDVGPAPKGLPRVGVQFEIDASGMLHVLARDTRTGAEKRVEMKSAVDVSDEAVENMVEQSVQHAFEDLRARQWIEARQLAADTLAAARKGLADCAAEIDSACKEQVGLAMRAVEEVLAGENLQTKTGDASRLKAAVSALDQASKPLAELLMDKAMDAMLRKRGMVRAKMQPD